MSPNPRRRGFALIAFGAIALSAAPVAARAQAGRAQAEDPLREVPIQASSVSAGPTGPPRPPSGWSIAYADAFGAPLGTGPGRDNTFFANNCGSSSNCTGFNANELEVMNPSAVLQTAEGVKLTCTYTAAAQSPGSKHYSCGTLRGLSEDPPAGYSFFSWSPGRRQTLVFQAIAKFPPNTDEADPAWWSSGPPWKDTEIDFLEGGGWSLQHTAGWKTDPLFTAWFAAPGLTASSPGFATDPSQAFHTYTFELSAKNTYSVWIDGVRQAWATDVGPASPDLAAKTTLVLSYALRTCIPCKSGFVGGSREFDVRSVAVYEDRAHVGVGIENGGLAPGTVVE